MRLGHQPLADRDDQVAGLRQRRFAVIDIEPGTQDRFLRNLLDMRLVGSHRIDMDSGRQVPVIKHRGCRQCRAADDIRMANRLGRCCGDNDLDAQGAAHLLGISFGGFRAKINDKGLLDPADCTNRLQLGSALNAGPENGAGGGLLPGQQFCRQAGGGAGAHGGNGRAIQNGHRSAGRPVEQTDHPLNVGKTIPAVVVKKRQRLDADHLYRFQITRHEERGPGGFRNADVRTDRHFRTSGRQFDKGGFHGGDDLAHRHGLPDFFTG